MALAGHHLRWPAGALGDARVVKSADDGIAGDGARLPDSGFPQLDRAIVPRAPAAGREEGAAREESIVPGKEIAAERVAGVLVVVEAA